MALRSWVSRGSVTRAMDSTNRGAFSRFFSDKGRVLSEEEQAKENVYIQVLSFSPYLDSISVTLCYMFFFCVQKWERERLEKQKLQGKAKAENDKNSAEGDKGTADKVHAFLFDLLILLFSNMIYSVHVKKLRFLLLFIFHLVKITMEFSFQEFVILHDGWCFSFVIFVRFVRFFSNNLLFVTVI